MIGSAAINRAADFLFAFCAGEHQKTVDWLCSLGCRVTHVDESGGKPGAWTLDGIAGVKSALCVGAGPLDLVPIFGFLLAGMFWPQVYGGLGTEVNRRLKQAKRNAARTPPPPPARGA
jgi:hypothetical protein